MIPSSGTGEAGRQVEDGLTGLMGLDPAGGEAAAVADAIHHEAQRGAVAPGAQEVGVERVELAACCDRAACRHHALGGHHAAEEAALPAARVAQEEVSVEGFEVKVLEKLVEGRLEGLFDARHASSAARGAGL